MQVLDGQAVSEADRTAAAAYSTQQAQMPSADSDSAAMLEQDTTISPTSLRTGPAAASALPSRASLQSSPWTGLQTLRTKSTGLRQKKCGAIGAVRRVTGQRTGSSDMSTGKPLLCLLWQIPHDTSYFQSELSINFSSCTVH